MDDLLEDQLDVLTKPRELGSVASLDTNRMRSVIRLFGIEIVCWNCEEAAEAIAKAIERPRQTPLLLVHVNVHTLRSILANNDLLKKLQERSLLLLEGIGLKSACLFTKGRAPADTNGTDLFPALLSALQSTRCRLYLLGSRPDVVALARQKIHESWPHVDIVGWRDGCFTSAELPAIRDQVSCASPTLLLIGMGSPKQEALALEFLQIPKLQLVWAVGGLFDRLSGRITRAPPLNAKIET